MEIIRSVSSFEKNPYNVSSNLSLSRAHFSKVHVFCMFKFMEVVLEVVEVMEVVHYLYIAAQSFNFHHQA